MYPGTPTIRPASPTFDDGLACARYLDVAAEGFFRILLGRRASELIAQAYTQPNNEYSYENVLFAAREWGQILPFDIPLYLASLTADHKV